ncbi:MAG: sulfurtransferase TusA family protein [Kiritimatiellia bacterium]
MSSPYSCRLPPDLASDIDVFEADVKRFQSGGLAPALFKAKRVSRGIYEQRRDGTFMVRARIPGGVLSAGQARALAALSRQYGNGKLHVTTRQDLQLHDVAIGDTAAAMRALLAAGLTCKGGGGNTVRNVTACPYAGVCPCEAFDVTPYALAITEYLITLPGSYNLPRKYKIALSGCAADCALASVNDLGFVARVRDGKPGFAVYGGGGLGSDPRVADRLEEWLPATACIRTAEAIRRLFDRLGDRRNRRRARLRFAVAKTGAEAFAGLFRRELEAVAREGVPECELNVPISDISEPPPGLDAAWVSFDGLRVLPQRARGRVTVPLALPLGRIGSAGLEALSGLAERYSDERGLRAGNQTLLLRGVREEDLHDLGDALRRLEVGLFKTRALNAFIACTGADTCRLGLCLSQPAARACAEALEGAGIAPEILQTVDIRINGCSNSCAQHPVGTIGLFGVALRAYERLVPGYRVLLGARRGEGRTRLGRPIGSVAARALPDFLAELLADFQSNRSAGESLSDYYDREGPEFFTAMLERHGAIPPPGEDPSYYRDWESEADFSLAGRGPGECGAGVFEVIGGDIAAARGALAGVGEAPDRSEALFTAVLAASRALLVTRGVESSKADDIFRAFESHFIDTGLVDGEFRGLLARARGYREGWREALQGKEEAIRGLADRVDSLFGTLDADLKFHPPEAAPAADSPAAGPAAPAAVTLDLAGVGCPMNFVKAKLRLETLAVGEVLSVILDDGAPAENVPASFRNEGQEVLAVEKADNGCWRVDIRKKQ